MRLSRHNIRSAFGRFIIKAQSDNALYHQKKYVRDKLWLEKDRFHEHVLCIKCTCYADIPWNFSRLSHLSIGFAHYVMKIVQLYGHVAERYVVMSGEVKWRRCSWERGRGTWAPPSSSTPPPASDATPTWRPPRSAYAPFYSLCNNILE